MEQHLTKEEQQQLENYKKQLLAKHKTELEQAREKAKLSPEEQKRHDDQAKGMLALVFALAFLVAMGALMYYMFVIYVPAHQTTSTTSTISTTSIRPITYTTTIYQSTSTVSSTSTVYTTTIVPKYSVKYQAVSNAYEIRVGPYILNSTNNTAYLFAGVYNLEALNQSSYAQFGYWNTTGNIIVDNANSTQTMLAVNGNGILGISAKYGFKNG